MRKRRLTESVRLIVTGLASAGQWGRSSTTQNGSEGPAYAQPESQSSRCGMDCRSLRPDTFQIERNRPQARRRSRHARRSRSRTPPRAAIGRGSVDPGWAMGQPHAARIDEPLTIEAAQQLMMRMPTRQHCGGRPSIAARNCVQFGFGANDLRIRARRAMETKQPHAGAEIELQRWQERRDEGALPVVRTAPGSRESDRARSGSRC